jgi:hypothetical protein
MKGLFLFSCSFTVAESFWRHTKVRPVINADRGFGLTECTMGRCTDCLRTISAFCRYGYEFPAELTAVRDYQHVSDVINRSVCSRPLLDSSNSVRKLCASFLARCELAWQ